MKSIYCLSGLGSDERVFSKLQFGENKVSFLHWKIPEKNESIGHYAERMAADIKDENPVLVGLSFGGMMSIEMAKIVPVEKVILVSSIKNYQEMPSFFRIAGKLKLDKVVPLKPYSFLNKYQNYNIGVQTSAQRKLVEEYRQSVNQEYLEWAIHEILNWKNTWTPEKLIHIHGEADRIFPIGKLKVNYSIPNGGHLMLLNNFVEINKILKDII